MNNCKHISRDCRTIGPGLSQCVCGQKFVFISRANTVGRFKKIEDLTDEDRLSIDPKGMQDFEDFLSGKLT
jgi:hypothetical protein